MRSAAKRVIGRLSDETRAHMEGFFRDPWEAALAEDLRRAETDADEFLGYCLNGCETAEDTACMREYAQAVIAEAARVGGP